MYFIVSEDVKKSVRLLPKELQKDLDDSDYDACQAFYTCNHPSYGIITSNTTYDTVSHEIGHVSRQLMENIGFKIKASNDEPLAYLEGFLADRIFHHLEKRKAFLP
jgi:hypothetical protein